MNKIRISVVSYLNASPFVYGINNCLAKSEYSLSLDIPSICASKLLNNEADIGLVPVAVLPELKDHNIISEYIIGAKGKVKSVLLLSFVPLEEIENILLDYQSRTSVILSKVLAQKLWKIDPQWIKAQEGYEKEIQGNTAGVVIGDRALQLTGKFPYIFDLSEEWMKLAGLPFVFACWVAHKKVPASFIDTFNKALKYGVDHRMEVINEKGHSYPQITDINNYLQKYIRYELDEAARKSLGLFLEYIKELEQNAGRKDL